MSVLWVILGHKFLKKTGGGIYESDACYRCGRLRGEGEVKNLTLRQLNRTYLYRQRLLTASRETPLQLVKALGAVQAQEGPAPYFALHARLASFEKRELDSLRLEKKVVRAHLHRNTVHLLATEEFLAWYNLFLPRLHGLMERWDPGYANPHLWLTEVREGLGSGAHTTKSVVAQLAKTLPQAPAHRASSFHLMAALELVRTHGPEGESLGAQEKWLTTEAYLGRRPEANPGMGGIVRRYLESYGPASPSDFSSWSGLPSQRKLFEAWAEAGDLAIYKDEDGRLLYDVPEGSILSGQEMPPRAQVLGDFDNLILSHQDRRRIVSDEVRKAMNRNLRSMAPMLIDGQQVGVWSPRKRKGEDPRASLEVFTEISSRDRRLLEESADAALAMWAPDSKPSLSWA